MNNLGKVFTDDDEEEYFFTDMNEFSENIDNITDELSIYLNQFSNDEECSSTNKYVIEFIKEQKLKNTDDKDEIIFDYKSLKLKLKLIYKSTASYLLKNYINSIDVDDLSILVCRVFDGIFNNRLSNNNCVKIQSKNNINRTIKIDTIEIDTTKIAYNEYYKDLLPFYREDRKIFFIMLDEVIYEVLEGEDKQKFF